MRIAGLDLSGNTGIALFLDGKWAVSSFKARGIERPADMKPTAVYYPGEGERVRQLTDYLRPLLVSQGITHMAVEEPLNTNANFSRTEVDTGALFAGGGIKTGKAPMQMVSFFRAYAMCGAVFALAARLGIEAQIVNQMAWRSRFLGVTQAPRGTEDGRKWLKARARTRCEQEQIMVKNDDQADAVGVAYWLAYQLDPAVGGRLL